MAFTPGLLCCSNVACALIKTGGAWERLPHQTEITFNTQASTAGVVTSDTAGREGKSCGTVATTGTIGLACHDGTLARLEVNVKYQIRFAKACSDIWEDGSGSDEYGAPVAVPVAGTYYQGTILITGEPLSLNISASETPVTVYTWELDGAWAAEEDLIVNDLS